MLEDDKKRLGLASGGNDSSILDKRLQDMVKNEVKLAKEYGDDYFKSGTGKILGRFQRGLGDSGEGLRTFTNMRRANNQMGDMYTNEELANMINKGFENAGLEYRFTLPEDLRTREKKAEGKLVGNQKKLDVNNDGQISGEDFKLLREQKQEGGLLEDDRQSYAIGSLVSKLVSKNFAKRNPKVAIAMYRDIDDKFGVTMDLDELKKLSPSDAQKALDYFKAKKLSEKAEFKERGRLDPSDADYYGEIERKKIFKEIDKEYEKQIKVLNDIIVRKQKQEGGSMDDQMQMVIAREETPNMLPDEEMEDNYLDFIIDEALDEEEESMLMSKLEQDEQLSMLFDKVLEVASEFAGSGPVEGPGSGVSDSIPARLSDGEFVFTAKATEQIGADELMRMMKDAEAAADRQGMQEGGLPMMENNPDEDLEESEQEIRNQMMGVNPRYQ